MLFHWKIESLKRLFIDKEKKSWKKMLETAKGDRGRKPYYQTIDWSHNESEISCDFRVLFRTLDTSAWRLELPVKAVSYSEQKMLCLKFSWFLILKPVWLAIELIFPVPWRKDTTSSLHSSLLSNWMKYNCSGTSGT